MANWSLSKLLENLHQDIQRELEIVRSSFGHSGTKGDASEQVWLDLLKKYLPKRYQSEKAFVVDSSGKFSDQIDVVIFDRQYSPFIFHYKDQIIVPAESVYAVFEAKQKINSNMIEYAQNKVESVRCLYRTSLPIPYAGGTYAAKMPHHIYGGILTLESDWSPPFGDSLIKALGQASEKGQLDFGCVAAHGHFNFDQDQMTYELHQSEKAATAFLFKLISQLQFSGTVPMIDIQAYAKWLTE